MADYKAKFIPSPKMADHDYVGYKDVKIPMSDGTILSANIFFPAKDGKADLSKKYPVVLLRSGYMALLGDQGTIPYYMDYFSTEQGFVLVINACRGTQRSEGVYSADGPLRGPLMDEGWDTNHDGADTVKWIAAQPWCDGRVVTFGHSWMGNTQYAIWLTEDVPELVTSAIQCPAINAGYNGWIYKGDFYEFGVNPGWILGQLMDMVMFKHLTPQALGAVMEDNKLLGGPLTDLNVFRKLDLVDLEMEYGLANMPLLRNVPFYKEWLSHRDDPDFFKYCDTSTRKHDAKRPLLFIASWYDLFNENSINGYMNMVEDAPNAEVAEGHRLIIGPWPHKPCLFLREYPDTDTDMRMLLMEWYQQQVNGITSEFFKDNKIVMYVMGENRWRSEKCWPLPDAESRKFFLHSYGPANTMVGKGTLSDEVPADEEAPDHYVYDPADPIRQRGGHSIEGGQTDQRPTEARPDVLCYTSEKLTEDIEVTGYAKASFFASTSATDTDFFLKIVDVCPDGICYNVASGGRRGRYIQKGRYAPEALTPGEIYQFEIDLPPVSYVFKKGHRIRVDICSSDALNYDINPNAFIDISTATKADYVVATQTVYHDAEHPAYIELPVIPESHEKNWLDAWPFNAEISGVDTLNDQKSGAVFRPAAFIDGSELR